MYLTKCGKVFGCGKNNRYQLGKKFNEAAEQQEIFDKYQPAKQLDFFDEKIVKVIAGKFHSLFIGESGKLYGLGFNMYGQLGMPNSVYAHAEEPVEVFLDGLKVKDVKCGAHHTLLLSTDH